MLIEIPNKLSFLKKYINSKAFLTKLGGYKDGGYVVDYVSILNSEILVSGGVGSNVRFESDFVDIKGESLKVILIDPTVSIFRMIFRATYHFFKKNQSGFRSFSEIFNYFYFRKKGKLISKFLNSSFDLNVLFEVELNEECKNVFLKLDIEGSEYDLLDSIIEKSLNLTGVCIEFHGLDIDKNVVKLEYFLERLNFDIINISINETCINSEGYPEILEISLSPKRNESLSKNELDYYYLQNSNSLDLEMVIFKY